MLLLGMSVMATAQPDSNEKARIDRLANEDTAKPLDETPGSLGARLSEVIATLKSMEVDGHACRKAIEAGERDIPKCDQFMRRVASDNGEIQQVGNELARLMTLEPTFYNENSAHFKQAARSMDRITGYTVTFLQWKY